MVLIWYKYLVGVQGIQLEKENGGEVVPSSLRVPRILSYLSPYSLKLQNTHALTIMNLKWQAIDTKDDTNPKTGAEYGLEVTANT